MLHDVYLYGALGEKYGRKHTFDITNAPQAARALAANFKEFFGDFKDGLYQVIIGKDRESGTSIDKDTLDYQIGKGKSVHIIPVIKGSGGNAAGVIKTVVGVVLIVVGVFTGQAWVVQIGIALTLNGVATLLTPIPKVPNYDERESPDRRASFIFNGATNRAAEGSAIPLVYGQMRTGSVIVSAGIQVEQT